MSNVLVPIDGKYAIVYPRPKNDEEFLEHLEELCQWYELYKDSALLNAHRQADLLAFEEELGVCADYFNEGNREGAYEMIYRLSKNRASLHNQDERYFDFFPFSLH